MKPVRRTKIVFLVVILFAVFITMMLLRNKMPREYKEIPDQPANKSEDRSVSDDDATSIDESESTVPAIQGHVTDTAGNPIPGAEVLIAEYYYSEDDKPLAYLNHGTTYETDKTGYYETGLFVKAEYNLYASAQGYGDSLRSGVSIKQSESGDESKIIDFILNKGLVCSGVVLEEDGAPIKDALIKTRIPIEWKMTEDFELDKEAWRESCKNAYPSIETKSLEDGSFMIDRLRDTGYEVTVHKPGYTGNYFDLTPPASSLKIVLLRNGSIKGQVISSINETPIDGYKIFIREYQEHSSYAREAIEEFVTRKPGGYFEVTNLAPNTVSVRIAAEGHEPYETEKFELIKGKTIDVGILKLEKGHTLSIKVVTGEYEAFVENAWIVVSEGDNPRYDLWLSKRGIRTDEYGICVVDCLPPGTAYITTYHNDYSKQTFKTEILKEPEEQSVTLKLAPPVTLTGNVVSDADGLPVSGARIFLRDVGVTSSEDHPRAFSGEDGSFSIGRLSVQAFDLEIIHPDYATFEKYIDVVPNMAPGTFRLLKGSTLIVTSKTENGEPVPDCIVELWGNNIEAKYRKTDENGEHVVENLRAGPVRVILSRDRNSKAVSKEQRVEITENETTRADFIIKPGYTVSGKLLNVDDGYGGLTVSLVPRLKVEEIPDSGELHEASADVDAQQGFSFKDVERGKYSLTLTYSDEGLSQFLTSKNIEVVDCDLEVDIDVAGSLSSISGKVTDYSGKPLAGVSVCVNSKPVPRKSYGSRGEIFDGWSSRGYRREIMTNINGRFQFKNIGPGEFVIGAELNRHITSSIEVEHLEGKDTEDVTIVLKRPVKITGTVSTADGAQLKEIGIEVYYRKVYDDDPLTGCEIVTDKVLLDHFGRYSFQELRKGEYYLRVSANGYGEQARNVKLDADVVSDIDFVLERGWNIRVTVKTSTGAPIRSAFVDPGDDKMSKIFGGTCTNDYGNAVVEALPSGVYKLKVKEKGFEEKIIDVTVGAEDQEIEVVLEEKE